MKKIYAHRGLSNEYVPNSLESIIACMDKNYIDGIEIDVRMTKDKRFVLFHDKKINGHCAKKGKIIDYNLNELTSINFKLKRIEYYNKIFGTINKKDGKAIRNNIKKIRNMTYKIVTLDKVLEIINNKELLIEIKCENLEEFDINAFYYLIKLYAGKKISIQNFNKNIIAGLRKIDKNLNLGLLLTIKDLKLNSYYNFYSIEYLLITKNKIDSSLIRNKAINLWTVNYYEDLDKIFRNINSKINVINYITDNPLIIYNVLKRLLNPLVDPLV